MTAAAGTHPYDAMPGDAITELPAEGDLVWVAAFQRWRPGRVSHLAFAYGDTLPVVEYTRPNGKVVVVKRKLPFLRRRLETT